MTAPYSPDNPFAPAKKGEAYSADNPFAPAPARPGLVTRLARADQQVAEGIVNFAKGTVTGTVDLAKRAADAVFGDPSEEEAGNALLRASRMARAGALPEVAMKPVVGAETPQAKAGEIVKGLAMTPVHQVKTLVSDPSLAHKTEAALGLATLAAPLIGKGVELARGRGAVPEVAAEAPKPEVAPDATPAPKPVVSAPEPVAPPKSEAVPKVAEPAASFSPDNPFAPTPTPAPAPRDANLFGEAIPSDAPAQMSLVDAKAGTPASRNLAQTEAASRAELDALSQRHALTPDAAERQAVAAKMAPLESLVNRDKAITADEMSHRAEAAKPVAEPVPSEPAAPVMLRARSKAEVRADLAKMVTDDNPKWKPAKVAAIVEQAVNGTGGYADLAQQLTDQKVRRPVVSRAAPDRAARYAKMSDADLAAEQAKVQARIEAATEEQAKLNYGKPNPQFADVTRARLKQGQVAQDAARHDLITQELARRATNASDDAAREVMAGVAEGGDTSFNPDEFGFARIRPPAVEENLPPEIRPAYQRAAAKIDFGGGLAKQAKQAEAGSLSNRIQRLGDAVANGQEPIIRLGEKVESSLPPTKNPKYLLSYAKSSDHTVARFIREGVVDPITREAVGPSYEGLFAPFGRDDRLIQQGLTYAVQKRLAARGVEAFGGDHAAFADAQALVHHFDADPRMAQFADQLAAYTDGIGEYAVKSGLWTPEQWAAMKASDALYIPIKRLMGGQPTGFPGSGKLANVTSGVKTFLGSRRAQANPAETLAAYTQSVIRRADAYRVGHSLFDAADKMGPEGSLILTRVEEPSVPAKTAALRHAAEQAKAAGHPLPPEAMRAIDDLRVPALDPHHPVIWRNGPNGREYAVVNAPDLYQAVAGMNMAPSAVQQFLDLTLLPIKRIFTAATTGFVPRFAGGTNPARDIAEALAKSRNKLTPVDIAQGYAEAIGGIAGKSKFAADAERFGLGNVSQFGDHQSAKAIAHRFAPTTMGQRLRGDIRSATIGDRSMLAGAERLGDASDKGPRLGEMHAAIRQVRGKLRSGEWTAEDVMLYATTHGRQITLDFSNRPGNPVVRAFSRYVPFAGPALQSPVSFARAAARNPARMATYASGVAAAAVGAWVLKHRSPEALAKTNDRPGEERGGFLLFPLDDRARLTLRMPLGQETALISSGVTAGLDAWYDKDPHAARQFVEAMIRALPPGIGELAQGNLTVPIPGVQQLLENQKNKRDFGGAPIVPERLKRLPATEQRTDQTPATYTMLGRALGTSPLKVQNAARGVVSQAEPLVTAITDPIARKIMGDQAPPVVKRPIRSNPLNPLSAFVANDPPYTTESERDYYALRTRLDQAKAVVHQAVTQGDPALALRAVSRGDLTLLQDDRTEKIMKAADRVLDDLNKQRTELQGQARFGIDVSRDLDTIRSTQQEVYRRVVTLLRPAPDRPAPSPTTVAARP